MNRAFRLIATSVGMFMVGVLLCFATSAHASCAYDTMSGYISKASVVAKGIVLTTGARGTAQLLISSYYKGSEQRSHITVGRMSNTATTVDVNWQLGKEYILFLQDTAHEYTADMCNGTRLVSDIAPADITLLMNPRTPNDSWATAIRPVATLIVVVLGAFFVGRMLRSIS